MDGRICLLHHLNLRMRFLLLVRDLGRSRQSQANARTRMQRDTRNRNTLLLKSQFWTRQATPDSKTTSARYCGKRETLALVAATHAYRSRMEATARAWRSTRSVHTKGRGARCKGASRRSRSSRRFISTAYPARVRKTVFNIMAKTVEAVRFEVSTTSPASPSTRPSCLAYCRFFKLIWATTSR